MKKEVTSQVPVRRKFQAGFSLLETVVALGVLLIVVAGTMALASISVSTTETQGHLAARTAEYGQDKMEQLLALAWGDTSSDTTQFPAKNVGGTGLAPGGSSNPNNPAQGYVDYLDESGNLTTAAAGWFYIRVWQIQVIAANQKQIAVTVLARYGVGTGGQGPQSTVTTLKSDFCPPLGC